MTTTQVGSWMSESAVDMDKWDWGKPSKVLLGITALQRGFVMHHAGAHIKVAMELGDDDAEDLGFDLAYKDILHTPGLHVWEGTFDVTDHPDPDFGPELFPVGTIRPPNEDELKALMGGRNPWDFRDWLRSSG